MKKVTLPPNLETGSDTGYSLWPASRFLTEHLLTLNLTNVTVLEIGCGLAIPSICMYHSGNRIICQDLPLLEHNLQLNMKENNVTEYTWLPCDWNNDEQCKEVVTRLPKVDLIIGSDVFYEEQTFSAIVRFVCRMMARDEATEFVTCYHHRDTYYSIAQDLELWGLKAALVGQKESLMIFKIKKVH